MARKPNAKPPTMKLDEEDGSQIEGDPEIVVVEDEGSGEPVIGADAAEESAEELRRQRDEAIQRAEKAERAAQQSNSAVQDTQLQVIDSMISKSETQKATILAEIKAAKETGDYDGEIAATDKLQQINIDIKGLVSGKNELSRRIEEAKEMSSADPVEVFVKGMPPRAADWVRSHSDVVTDAVKNAKLQAAHYDALREGNPVGSDSYFEFIEDAVYNSEPKKREQQQEEPQRQERQQQRQRAPAAPPSRGNPGGGNGSLPPGVERVGQDRYRLSPQLREYARIAGVTDKEYLDELFAIQREKLQ